jgi:hypothetical protein
MINGKRDINGMYVDSRHARLEPNVLHDDDVMENQAYKEKKMSLRLLLINRIKVLLESRLNDKNYAMVKEHSSRIKVMSPPIPKNMQQSRLSRGNTIRLGTTAMLLVASGRADRPWLTNQRNSRDVAQTPSYLG